MFNKKINDNKYTESEVKMGLTNNQMELIKAVSQNNLQFAKKCAVACVTEDTTQKNQHFCKKYKQILESPGNNLLELPGDLKGIICAEDVSNSFKEDRYFLSEREKTYWIILSG